MFYVLESDNSDGLLRLYSANNMAVIEIGQELDRDRMDDELHGIYTLTVSIISGWYDTDEESYVTSNLKLIF